MVEPFIPDECPDYLGHFMRSTSKRLLIIEGKLDTLLGINPKGKGLAKTLRKPNSEKAVTFKWLVEKLVVPAMFMAAGYLLKG